MRCRHYGPARPDGRWRRSSRGRGVPCYSVEQKPSRSVPTGWSVELHLHSSVHRAVADSLCPQAVATANSAPRCPVIRRTMPTGSRSRATSAHAGRTQRSDTDRSHATLYGAWAGLFGVRPGTQSYGAKWGVTGCVRKARQVKRNSSAAGTENSPCWPCRDSSDTSSTALFTHHFAHSEVVSKEKDREKKKKTVEMYCNFLRLLFVARNRNRVVPTKRFSGHVASLQGATRSYGTSK